MRNSVQLTLHIPIDTAEARRIGAGPDLCRFTCRGELDAGTVASLVFATYATGDPIAVFAEDSTLGPAEFAKQLSFVAVFSERSITVDSLDHLFDLLSNWKAEEFFIMSTKAGDPERAIPASDPTFRLTPSGNLHRYVQVISKSVPLFVYARSHSSLEMYGLDTDVFRAFEQAFRARAAKAGPLRP